MTSPGVLGGSAVDPPGFRAVFDAHFGRLVGLGRLLGSDDPEDLAAEAFARLHDKWPSLRDERAALAYARATVLRLSANRRRHLAVAARHSGDHQTGALPSAEFTALQRARDDELLAALRGLTAARRAALVLRYYAEASYEEIGAALTCRVSTARSHVRRGLADLRRVWREEADDL